MAQKPACCLACHFRREETEIFPRLPKHVADMLQREHDALGDPNVCPTLIRAHAEKEMRWFRVFGTSEQVAWCELDHEHLGGGKAKHQCSGGCSQRSY